MRAYHWLMLPLFAVHWLTEVTTGTIARLLLFSPVYGCCLGILVWTRLGQGAPGGEVGGMGESVGSFLSSLPWGVWAGGILLLAPLWFPPLFSLAGLLLGGGASFSRWKYGARQPSEQEHRQIDAALRQAGWVYRSGQREGQVRPLRVLVTDSEQFDAFVIGTAVYLSPEAVWCPWLPAVLAHELHHARTLDGRICLAINRLYFVRLGRGVVRVGLGCGPVSLLAGILVSLIFKAAWMYLHRLSEYAADRAAHEAGLGPMLADFLGRFRPLDLAIPGMDLFMSHPHVEQRIEALQRLQQARV